MVYKYPSTDDYEEIVREFVKRDGMQKMLKENKHFLVHANGTGDLAAVSKRILFGYDDTERLREFAFNKSSETSSTAFSLRSHAENDDLLDDLEDSIQDEDTFDTRKELVIDSVSQEGEGIRVKLQYKNKRIGRRDFISTDTKFATITIGEPDEQGVRTVTQDYEKIDEFNAVSSFVDGWKSKRLKDEDMRNIEKFDLSLKRLPLERRIQLLDDLLYSDPGNWQLEDVMEIGIKQGESREEMFGDELEEGEELEDLVDDNLQGITDAVVSGEGLRENGFVKTCEENGYYFNEATLYFDNTDVARKVKIGIGFKEGSHNNVDIVVKQGYLKEEDGTKKTDFDEDVEKRIREEFREMAVENYYDAVRESEGVSYEEPGPNTFEDITGVGPDIVDSLRDAGIETFDDIEAISVSNLQEFDGIGEKLAERLKNAAR